jgi:hypothetical protein
MELATLCPIDRCARRRLEHLQEGLGILHGAHAIEDYDTVIRQLKLAGFRLFLQQTFQFIVWPDLLHSFTPPNLWGQQAHPSELPDKIFFFRIRGRNASKL